MNCGEARANGNMCVSSASEWTGTYTFTNNSACSDKTCCCPKGDGTITASGNNYAIVIPCSNFAPINITVTKPPANQIYITLPLGTGSLIRPTNGILYQDENGLCVSFGETKGSNAGLIAGVVIGVILAIALVGFAVWWFKFRTPSTEAETAPLRR